MKVRAEFRRKGKIIRTRFYPSAQLAQAYLQDHIGWFNPLGSVSGDVFENGQCTSGPRNGGLVSLKFRYI